MSVDPSDPKHSSDHERHRQARGWLISLTGFVTSFICAGQIMSSKMPSGSLTTSIRIGTSFLYVHFAKDVKDFDKKHLKRDNKILEDAATRDEKGR